MEKQVGEGAKKILKDVGGRGKNDYLYLFLKIFLNVWVVM